MLPEWADDYVFGILGKFGILGILVKIFIALFGILGKFGSFALGRLASLNLHPRQWMRTPILRN